ncbi:DUF418 domain-containing protein [Brevibacillus composti]|uniref:DUF418 domain-containing protein n=1 Tax=Brevibacillus composti TaxID=2796470 RepID=A0A7T5JM69_9BACL|nr:DUF418 domain-containing protein [Brevibacillus composti]QQE72690.1 DUF418 domain-containing protein [Brevibacillus composti]QUO39768.1 DUF418 domain-containing protein [Brevibacillus composti]
MHASPTPPAERIRELDVIRGVALFGIFLVNISGFLLPELLMANAQRLPENAGAVDVGLRMVLDMFVQTKFYTIFSFLFGAGFFLFISRLEQKGEAVVGKYLRRLFVLLVFGLIHLVFWFGDILHSYALAGVFLLLFYRRSPAVIRRWAIVLLALLQIPMGLALLVPDDGQMSRAAYDDQLARQAIEVYQNGGWQEWLSFRIQYELPILASNEWLVVLSVLPLFLLGLYAAKIGLFHRPEQHLPAVRRYWRVSFLIGMPLSAMIPLVHFDIISLPASSEMARLVFVQWSGLALFVFYITSILLLMRKEKGRERLAFLEPVGRMALTNYAAQTLLCVTIIDLFHLYGRTPLWAGLLFCLVILPLQALGSRWWLARYRFGPVEWLWRCLTYGAWQPLKR